MLYFDEIASQYDRIRGKEIFDSLLSTVKLLYNGNNDWILDVGTGTGLFSSQLSHYGYRIIGIDKNSQMLFRAISKGSSNGYIFKGVLGSAEKLPFPSQSFYLVISTNAIHHFKLYQHFQEVTRILKPGGHYIIFSRFHNQNVRSIWGQYFPHFAEKETRLYNSADFEQLTRDFPEMKLISSEELKFEIPFSAQQLIEEEKQKKYSNFVFYSEKEFKNALQKFEANIVKHKNTIQNVEIGRIIFRKM